MFPVLFQWRGFTIYSFPAFLYFGLIAGTGAGNIASRVEGIDALRTYTATVILIVFALLGSKLFYVAVNWESYRGDLRRIWDRRNGGAAMYGGYGLALVLSVPLLAVLRVPFAAFWDVSMFTILVGMIFARVGCFLNGCCCGRPARTWGIYLPNGRGEWEKRVPTQLLEILFAVTLLAVAILIQRRVPFQGALFLIITAAYASGRILIESLRERQPGSKPFNVYHALSLVMIFMSLAALVKYWPS